MSIKIVHCLFAEVGGQCVVGLPDKELGRLFEEGGQVRRGGIYSEHTLVVNTPGGHPRY